MVTACPDTRDEHDLEIAVQSGGHAAAGFVGRDGGLVINLSNMRGVQVEPDRTLGAYANGNSEAGPAETRRIFGDAKVARLAALKRAYDPDNIFHVNPNVAPAPD